MLTGRRCSHCFSLTLGPENALGWWAEVDLVRAAGPQEEIFKANAFAFDFIKPFKGALGAE